jgi:hypothetical protein
MRHIAATILFLSLCISNAQDVFQTAKYRRIREALDSRAKVVRGLLKRQDACGSSPISCPGGDGLGCCVSGEEQCCQGEWVGSHFGGQSRVADLISSDGICCPADGFDE